MHFAFSVYLNPVLIERATYLPCIFPSPVHFFHLPGFFLIVVRVLLFLWRMSSSLSVSLSPVTFTQFVSHSGSLSFSIFLFVSSLIKSPSKPFSKSALRHDFGKFAKEPGSKIDTEVRPYGGMDGCPMVVGLVRISGASVADPDVFQRYVLWR